MKHALTLLACLAASPGFTIFTTGPASAAICVNQEAFRKFLKERNFETRASLTFGKSDQRGIITVAPTGEWILYYNYEDIMSCTLLGGMNWNKISNLSIERSM